MTTDQIIAARAAAERVAARHATIAAPHHLAGNCADCLTERAPCDARVTAAIAEAGLRLRDEVSGWTHALGRFTEGDATITPGEVAYRLARALHAYDAAVRAACGEGV